MLMMFTKMFTRRGVLVSPRPRNTEPSTMIAMMKMRPSDVMKRYLAASSRISGAAPIQRGICRCRRSVSATMGKPTISSRMMAWRIYALAAS